MDNLTIEGISISNFTVLNFLIDASKYYTIPLGITTVSSNMIVVVSAWVIVKSAVEPKSTYMIIGNLALADTLVGVVFLILNHLITEKGWHLCAFIYGCLHWCIIESSFSMLLSAIDRYLYFSYGLYYPSWMSTKRTVYMLLTTWLFSLLTGFVPQMLLCRSDTDCLYFSSTPTTVLITLVFTSCLAFVITILLYILIVFTVRKASKRAKSKGRNTVKVFRKNDRQITPNNTSRKKSESFFSKRVFVFENYFQNTAERTEENNIFCISFRQIDQEHCLPKIQKLISTKNNQCKESLNQIRQFTENKTIRNKQQTDRSSTKKRKNKLNSKSIVIILLIALTFAITWGPVLFFDFIYSTFCSSKEYSKVSKVDCSQIENVFLYIAINFGLVSLLLTPVIYCWWHTRFRKSLLKVCFKGAVREKKRRDLLLALKQ